MLKAVKVLKSPKKYRFAGVFRNVKSNFAPKLVFVCRKTELMEDLIRL